MQKASILVIDDNPANLGVLAMYLEAANYEVLVARTGESGLEKAEYANPELILLDLVLPNMDGFEVCRRLKANPKTQKIPVIFMTSLLDMEHKLDGLRLGAVDYLIKPVQAEELTLRVNTHVQLSRLTHHLENEVAERTRALREEMLQRQKAQEKLAYHAMLLEEISDAIISTNEQYLIQSWNRAAELLYGYTEAEAFGKTVPDLLQTIYPNSNRDEFLETLRTVGHYQGELIHRHKDGRNIPVWINLSALKDETGKVYGYVTINHDTSLQKEAEEQRLKLARLQERTEVLNNLLGTVSHDLRTPLAIIETNLYFLDRLSEGEKAREKLQAIRKQTGHLKKLIDDLLTISRLDHQASFPVAPIELNQLVSDIVHSLEGNFREREQQFELKLGEMPKIEANESELYRALINLIENAMNYTPRGGKIRLETGVSKERVWLNLIDNGIGIGEAELPHIFERYYRADKARNINTGGTGLGLAIVKRIVEMHNGHIEVESQINQGTTFHLHFPIHCPPTSDVP